MIITKAEAAKKKPVIDLTGPNGNVFYMIACYHRVCEDSGLRGKALRDETINWYKGCTYSQVVEKFIRLVGDRADIILPDEVVLPTFPEHANTPLGER